MEKPKGCIKMESQTLHQVIPGKANNVPKDAIQAKVNCKVVAVLSRQTLCY